MRRAAFSVVILAAVALPLAALAVAASIPAVRSVVGGFFAPLPTAPLVSPPSTVVALPPQTAITGAESSELHGLLAADAGAATRRMPRTRLFPSDLAASHDPFEHPRGLKRVELSSREDPSIDRAIHYLVVEARGHGALTAALKTSGRHRDEVERILRAWKVPAELAAIPFVESGFVPTYSAFDGGAGLWSLPPEVAHAYGLAVLDKYDERRSVALSTEAAGHYLADLHERFGSWELALFAFGSGYGVALETLSKKASLEYWDIAPELLPEGTTYVAEVLAVTTMLANVDRFALDPVHVDPPEVASDLEVPAGAPFGTVARAAGTSIEHLHELNPEYLGDSVPKTDFVMIMHVPSEGLKRAQELLMPLMYSTSGGAGRGDAKFDWGHHNLPGRPPDGGDPLEPEKTPGLAVDRNGAHRAFYRVQDGDTLEALARRFSVSRERIITDNALDPSAGLRPGQLLLLRAAADGGAHGP